jgi:hypothetical protein
MTDPNVNPETSSLAEGTLPESIPLTPFELFMVEGDRHADYPVTLYAEMEFEGIVDVAAMRQAANLAARRSPLLLSRLTVEEGVRVWKPGAFEEIFFSEATSDQPDLPPRIDLTREPGLRMLYSTWQDEGAGRSFIRMQYHHACCDGQGARRFIIDTLSAYHRLLSGDDTLKMDRLDYDRLLERGTFPERKDHRRTTTREKIRYAWGFHFQPPNAVAVPHTSCPDDGKSGPRPTVIIRHNFSRSDAESVLAQAAECEESLNDIATALLFRTLARWNEKYARPRDCRRLRVLVPIDLRTPGDARLPSANRLGFGFLSRQFEDCLDVSSLVPDVREQMNLVKDQQLARDFVDGLVVFQTAPWLARWTQRWPECMATALLTNLGDPWRRFRRRFARNDDGRLRFGNLTPGPIYCIPPLRRGTRVGVGVAHDSHWMTVSLQADRTMFDQKTAAEFMDLYLAEWRAWCPSMSETPGEEIPVMLTAKVA